MRHLSFFFRLTFFFFPRHTLARGRYLFSNPEKETLDGEYNAELDAEQSESKLDEKKGIKGYPWQNRLWTMFESFFTPPSEP